MLPSRTERPFRSRPICVGSTDLPLYVKAVLRDATTALLTRERSVVRLSVTPSTNISCSRSTPRLVNGSTTIDKRGAAGFSAGAGLGAGLALGAGSTPSAKTRVGWGG